MKERIFQAGEFLITEAMPEDIFVPEDFDKEQRLIARSAEDFINGEVLDKQDELEELNPELLRELLWKSGELGFLSADIPEVYGGLELDKVSSSLIAEQFGKGPSGFAIAYMVHTGIGSLPIVLFGTVEQKQRWLAKLAGGEIVGAFALTEPEHGSDALGAKTTAVLSADGKHYILNGQKQFITNAGFADVFSTYAQVDGDKFTSFIVERNAEGVSVDAEEKKMGMHGSSTCSVVFQDAKVPVENMLGEVGKGHAVALTTLNVGRYKIAAIAVGAAKMLIQEAVRHAKTRVQFGKPIAEFGLIKTKIADIVIRTFVCESMAYRTARLLDGALEDVEVSDQEAGHTIGNALRGYALECSITKVFGSEMLHSVADECVQILGGYGYIQDNPVEGAYRDSRIHRIWEGTNEILRLTIMDVFMRTVRGCNLNLEELYGGLKEDLQKSCSNENDNGSVVSHEQDMVRRARIMTLIAASVALEAHGDKISDEQEIIGAVADMIIELFAMESGLLRAIKKWNNEGEAKAEIHRAAASTYIHEALPKIAGLGRSVLASVFDGEELERRIADLESLARCSPVNTISLKRKIAAAVLGASRYHLTKS